MQKYEPDKPKGAMKLPRYIVPFRVAVILKKNAVYTIITPY